MKGINMKDGNSIAILDYYIDSIMASLGMNDELYRLRTIERSDE